MKRISAALVAVLAVALSLAAQAPASGSAVVKNIGFVKSDAGLEISVLVNGVFNYDISVLTSPDRLVIDISPAERIEALPTYDVNTFGITAIRTGQYKPKVSRVILDCSGPAPQYSHQRTESGLIIKIAAPPPPPPAPAEKPATPAAPVEPVKEYRPVEEAKPAPKVEIAAPAVKTSAPQAEIKEPAGGPVFYNTTVGLLGGSYKNDSERFGEVYGSGTSLQFGLNLTRTLLYIKGVRLDVSGEARMISKTGKATLSGDAAKIRIYPLTVAALLMFDTKYIIPYAGYGRDWFNYKETSALADTSGSASGDHFQGGLFIVIPGMENLRIKVYYKYTRVTATENEIEVKLGGPEIGLGVSFGFNFLNKAAVIVR